MAQRPRQTRIQFQSQFRPTSVDTMAADAMRQLAGLGRTMGQVTEQIGRPIVEQEMAEKGAKAAQEARTVDPETGEVSYNKVDKKSFGWGYQQYNAQLMRGYSASVQSDARKELSRIAIEADGDVEKYNELVKGYKAGSGISNLPPEIAANFDIYENTYRSEVVNTSTTRNLENSNAALLEDITQTSEDTLRFIANGEASAALAAEQEYYQKVDAEVTAGRYNEGQGERLKKEFRDSVFLANKRRQLDVILEDPNGGEIAGYDFIQEYQDNRPADMSVKAHEAHVATLFKQLQDSETIYDARQAEMAETRTLAQKANATSLFVGIMRGEVGAADLASAAMRGDIDGTQLGTLETQLSTTGGGVDNPDIVNLITEAIKTDPDAAMKLIEQHRGSVNLTNATALTLAEAVEKAEDEEFKRFSTLLKDNIIAKGEFGLEDPAQKKRNADMQIVFARRVAAGENPAIVANELINANRGVDVAQPTTANFGQYLGESKSLTDFESTDGSLMKALLAGDITEEQYNMFVEEAAQWFASGRAYANFQATFKQIMSGK